jgi:hypothetical protein
MLSGFKSLYGLFRQYLPENGRRLQITIPNSRTTGALNIPIQLLTAVYHQTLYQNLFPSNNCRQNNIGCVNCSAVSFGAVD